MIASNIYPVTRIEGDIKHRLISLNDSLDRSLGVTNSLCPSSISCYEHLNNF